MTGRTDREWAYVAMSRGRQTNTLYLANPEPSDEHCTHLTRPEGGEVLDALTASLGRSSAHAAAIDHFAWSAAPGGEVAERVAWIIARRRAERDELERTPPDIELAAER